MSRYVLDMGWLDVEDEWVVGDFLFVVAAAFADRASAQFAGILFNDPWVYQYVSVRPVQLGCPGLSDFVLLVVIIFHV